MNYKESSLIFEKIKKSKRILVNLHKGPDPDSFGCALALYKVLRNFGKEVDVVCTSNSNFMTAVNFLPNVDVIQSVDFEKFDFEKYDLLIASDTQTWQHIVDNQKVDVPKIDIAVIDHHPMVNKYGTINLVDLNKTSCAELLYLVFKDWGVKIDSDTATCLLTGLIGDTHGYQFTDDPDSFIATAELMKLGANKKLIIDSLYRSEKLENIMLWGEFLVRYQRGRGNFLYTAVPYDIYSKYGKPAKISSQFATFFGAMVKDVKFSIIMLEKDKQVVDISLRANGEFDVSKIASELGGGGHPNASGARVEGFPFENAVEKVLAVARKYAKN